MPVLKEFLLIPAVLAAVAAYAALITRDNRVVSKQRVAVRLDG